MHNLLLVVDTTLAAVGFASVVDSIPTHSEQFIVDNGPQVRMSQKICQELCSYYTLLKTSRPCYRPNRSIAMSANLGLIVWTAI